MNTLIATTIRDGVISGVAGNILRIYLSLLLTCCCTEGLVTPCTYHNWNIVTQYNSAVNEKFSEEQLPSFTCLPRHNVRIYKLFILIIVQRDATQSSLFIILQVHSTCFGCQPHPSSGVHETVTTASGTVQLPPSNVAKLAWPRWREVAAQKNMTTIYKFYVYGSMHRWAILIIVQRDATQSSLFIILQVHSTCFQCQPHPSSGVHRTVTTASGTGHIFCAVKHNKILLCLLLY